MTSIAMHTLPHPDIIIFDVDGTLIDVSRSYREAAPVAASIYLRLLGRMGLARFFGAITTMTDAVEAQEPGGESLLKPHPFLLQRAADILDPSGRETAAYIGDAPDDIMAARRADATGPRRWIAAGIASAADQVEHYRRLGADIILRHPDELAKLWQC